ncbi:MAG: hypothetical protein HY327_00805 [Chloroflexi bacterium]|nr:hypothetical protein [Chloroflexota bacterium]
MNKLANILETPPFGMVRRNHGIEHATVHILTARNPNLSLVGRADTKGFYILGDVTERALRAAALEAVTRLQNGEANLAIHPRCGTNLVTAGLLAGVAALIAMGRKPSIRKLPDVILATTFAAFIAQPIGLQLQARVTTSPDARGARIGAIRASRWGNLPMQHVDVEWSA